MLVVRCLFDNRLRGDGDQLPNKDTSEAITTSASYSFLDARSKSFPSERMEGKKACPVAMTGPKATYHPYLCPALQLPRLPRGLPVPSLARLQHT